MRSLLLTFAALFSVGAIVGGGAWLLYGSDLVRLEQVRVVGNARASEASVRHLADLAVGEPLVAQDLARAVHGVERHPWVRRASARRVFPDTVVLQVEEREIAALLLTDGLFLVDHEGVPFRRATPGDLDHPVITGLPASLVAEHPAVARRVVSEALAWMTAVDAHPSLDVRDLSEVRFERATGYALVFRNGGEILVGFRSPSDALGRLDLLLSNGVELSARPARVDLAQGSLAVVTLL